jgi:hypothetical protein
MDSIAPQEIQLVAAWCPEILTIIANLCNAIESTGQWPHVLTKGAVCFLPKISGDNLSPTDYRPLTILSSIYRLWAATRQDQLCEQWLPHWQHQNAYGLKQASAADALAYHTCLDFAQSMQQGQYAGGLSYDMRKCFDSIPTRLILHIFNLRGADSKVTRALTGFYAQHQKFFRLEGHHSHAFKPSNGIVQGCPLSMILLTSLMTAWIEYCQHTVDHATPRSYADDLSLITTAPNPTILKDRISELHNITAEFIRDAGMTLNQNKSFTFGHKSITAAIPSIKSHQQQFRLVGGSVSVTQKGSWTELEKSRQRTWQSTTDRIRHLPVGWFTKVKILQSTRTQLSFGQGTHTLHLDKNLARSLRACAIRTLLNTTFYDASPGIIFSLLAPPTLDPEFGLHYAACQLIFRIFQKRTDHLQIFHQITDPHHQIVMDGPISRIKQLFEHPVFKQTIDDFLHHRLNFHTWQHDLRERYRSHIWAMLSRDRPQHFRGIQTGINRKLTTSLIDQLTREADEVQYQLDHQQIAQIDESIDPRPKLKILRLILSAGVQTPERDHRHRKRPGSVVCACKKASPTIYHISWECECFQQERQPALAALPKPLASLPTCFQISTIVPNNLIITEQALHTIQRSMINVWQANVRQWYGLDTPISEHTISPQVPVEAAASTNQSNTEEPQPVIKRGHILRIIPSGGIFCVRCGKQTQYQKHARLKILNKPCQFPDLDQSQWLTSPGFNQSINRLLEAERQLNEKWNKADHNLIWNRKLGKKQSKPDYGMIWCASCGKTWSWASRSNSLAKPPCSPPNIAPVPPSWVKQLDHYTPQFHHAQSTTSSSQNNPTTAVRRRITGKQKPTNDSSQTTVIIPSGAASSSSSAFPKRGIG